MAVKHLKTEEFVAAVEAAPLAMVDFWASWCGPCKMLSPVIEAIGEQFDGKVLVGKVNVDEEPALAAQFGVMSIPTLLVFQNGRLVNQAVGARPKSGVLALLDR